MAPGSAGLSLLAGIAIDKIIEKADVVSEVRLKVTGNLSDPQVQEVKRFTKTISIPRPPQRPITPIDPNEQPAEKSDNKSTEQSKSQSEAKPETNTDKKSGQGQ